MWLATRWFGHLPLPGKPGLILTSFPGEPTDALGRNRTRHKLQRRSLAAAEWTDVPGFSFKGDASSVTSPVFRVAPLEDEAGEPWVILRIVRQ